MSAASFSSSAVKPLNSVLVKPAGPDCNLQCGYCFYLDKEAHFAPGPHRMSEAVLTEMVRQMMLDSGPMVSFGWQGGEPTLMGLDFFRHAVQLQRRFGQQGQSVGNGLQTNGLLIDDEWCAFLKQFKFLVGLSIDGPREVHDRYRSSRGGQPTWEKVARAARLLLQSGVATNALAVVNEFSARFPEEIYAHLLSLGFRHLQFIPCVEPDPADPTRAAGFSVGSEAYGEFLCRVFDRWQRDFKNGWPTISVRWFDSVFHTYVRHDAPECTLMEECGCYAVVEHNGDVYACDFFVEPAWRLGNVLEGDLIEFLNSARQRAFGRLKRQLPVECTNCRWLAHCRGGCTKDRTRDPRTGGSNYFCQSFRMFFEHADPLMRVLAEKFQKREAEREIISRRRQGKSPLK
jgi:uncharacterized protein